jgi:hypothetical protein
MEPAAPVSETASERVKAHVKVPIRSFSHPAAAGSEEWRTPKIRVMHPRPAGASFLPMEHGSMTSEGQDGFGRERRKRP